MNVVAFFIAVMSQLLDQEMPFTTIQLLWVNIIMDGPPALALGLEPIRKSVLKHKPVNRKASIITKNMLITILCNAVVISGIILGQMMLNPLGAAPEEMRTVLFGLFAFLALFNAFNCREMGAGSIIPNFLANKMAFQIIGGTAAVQLVFTQVFNQFFNTVPLSVDMWCKVIGAAACIIIINEVSKFVVRLVTGRKQAEEGISANA